MSKTKKTAEVFLAAALICGAVSSVHAGQETRPTAAAVVFPGVEWERRDPAVMGLAPEALKQIGALMEKAQANGVLIRNGYLVAEWNYSAPPDTRINVKSMTKCILGMVYALAIADGLIPDSDTMVKKLWPGFNAGPYADKITFNHLVTATSGLKATGPFWQSFTSHGKQNEFRPPGMPGEYNNDHCMYLAGALTYLYERDLLEVLRERILTKIGADASWSANGEDAPEGIGNHGTYRSADSDDPIIPPGYVTLRDGRKVRWVTGFSRSRWTARDLARVGWLHLNDGKWNGDQLISPAYIREFQRNIPDQPYLAWRCNKDKGWWAMSGAGGQFCVLIPEHNMVLAKVNAWQNSSNCSFRGREQVDFKDFVPFLSRVVPPISAMPLKLKQDRNGNKITAVP